MTTFPAELLPAKGDRIKFVRHRHPDPDPLTPGEEGTVLFANAMQVAVTWDSGRGLGLIPSVDVWEVISRA